MAIQTKNTPAWGADGPLECQLLAGVDGSESAPKIVPDQAQFLRDAVIALAAGEIRAGTLENVQLMLAASGWRSTAALLKHAAECAEGGDFLNAERNRQRARELFIEGNDAFRQFMEARSAQAFAEAYQ